MFPSTGGVPTRCRPEDIDVDRTALRWPAAERASTDCNSADTARKPLPADRPGAAHSGRTAPTTPRCTIADTCRVSGVDGPAAIVLVARALERTRDAGLTRFSFDVEHRLPMLSPEAPEPRRSLVRAGLRAVGALAARVGKPAMRLLFRRQSAEGFLDVTQDRYMMDFGEFAMLGIGPHQWSGRSGRAISTLPEEGRTRWEPLWLLAMLHGVTEAVEIGTEPLHGAVCRRFAVRADVTRAAAAVGDGLPLPPADHYRDLLRVALECWLDEEGRVRRVVHESELAVLRLDFLEFSVDEPLDWSRLPTFRSKEEDE
jgi:hypothetical protein